MELKAQYPIKALNDQGRVGGYLVVWGNPAQKDLQGEYFTPDTELGIDWYNKRPALYHHALDETLKGMAAVVGEIDTLKADEVGVWAEAQLDMHHQYIMAVRQLIDKGVLGWSSGSLPQLVDVAPDGRIKRWPIVEGSLTPAPAEPRHTDISFIKSAYAELGLDFSKLVTATLETTEPTDAKEPQAKEQPAAKLDESVITINVQTQPEHEEERTMNPLEMIMQLIDALLQAKPEWQLTPEERQALAQQVASGMEMGTPEAVATAIPEPQLPVLAKAAGIIVRDVVSAHFAAKTAAETARKNAINGAITDAMKAAPAVSNLPAFTGNGNGNHVPAPAPRIELRTKYADLSAEDMSYYIGIRNAMRRKNNLPAWTPESAFIRELADKAGKSYEAGTLKFGGKEETANAVKSINAFKSDELDYSTQATYGDEWVPDLWSNQLWEKARLDNIVLPLFQNVEMPSNPYELPIESTDPTVYYVAESTAETNLTPATSGNPIPDSKVATGKVQLSAKKLALRVGFSTELDEDSIIPWTAQLRNQAMRAMEDAIDNVLLNGDTETGGTGNVNLVDSAPPTGSKYLALDGLRKQWLVTTTGNGVTASGAAITLAQINAARFTLARAYSANPGNLAIITHPEQYAKLLMLPEFLTMDVVGTKATNLTGQIGVIHGMPVLVSNEYALTNTAGKVSNTAGNNTLGSLTIVYKPGWYVGYRRRINATVEFLSYSDAYQLTATVRLAFISRDSDCAAGVYNSLV